MNGNRIGGSKAGKHVLGDKFGIPGREHVLRKLDGADSLAKPELAVGGYKDIDSLLLEIAEFEAVHGQHKIREKGDNHGLDVEAKWFF